MGASTTSAAVNVTVNAAAQLFFIHPDHLNTPRLITNQVGQAVWRWDNADPFGANVPNEDPDNDTVQFVFNLRFPGQYADRETGLAYNYFRDYDPSIGRYIQSDQLGLEGGINIYAYVTGNPLLYSDPYGLWTIGDPLPQGVVNFSAGLGQGILSTMSFGLVSGNSLRNALGISGGVNVCSPIYNTGVLAGAAVTLAAYAYAAIPSTLTHFTTQVGATGIAQTGSILPSTGANLFGNGVYAATIGRPLNLFVPAASNVPVPVSGSGFMRIIPGLVFLRGGSLLTGAWFAGYAALANRTNLTSAITCLCSN